MAITGHEPNPAYDYFPDGEAVESPYDVSDANWRPKRDRATAHYAHPFAAPLRPLRHQIARFRRGDSLLIVAAWNASDDTLLCRCARACCRRGVHRRRRVSALSNDPTLPLRAASSC